MGAMGTKKADGPDPRYVTKHKNVADGFSDSDLRKGYKSSGSGYISAAGERNISKPGQVNTNPATKGSHD